MSNTVTMASRTVIGFSRKYLSSITSQSKHFSSLSRVTSLNKHAGVPILTNNFCSRLKSTVTVNFKFPDGSIKSCEAKQGSNLLDVVLDHDVDIDGFGACEGTLACSTCHLILPPEIFEKLPPPVDEELDMLDLAFGLTETSRLGCQVILTKDLDGLTVDVPATILDARG